jgi:hypothetical protein
MTFRILIFGKATRISTLCVQVLGALLIAAHVAPAAGDDNTMAAFEAVWMPSRVSRDDPRWRIEDFACGGCTLAGFKRMQQLLNDPANDERHIRELISEVQKFEEELVNSILTPLARKKLAQYDPTADPTIGCTPEGDGFEHQITAPLPFEIEQVGDELVIRYEYWNAIRRIRMNGTSPGTDAAPARLGDSTGRLEGPTLVVETVNLIPNMIGVLDKAIRLSSDAKVIERYTVNDNGNRLDLELSVIDPENFREPYVGQYSVLLSPGWELDVYVCEATTGEF